MNILRDKSWLTIAFCIISLSVLVTATRREFTFIESSESSDSEDTSREKSAKKHLFDLNGQLRKSFALEIFLSHEIQNMACSPVSALMPLAKLTIGATGATEKELLEVIGVSRKTKINHRFRKIISQLKRIPGVNLKVASRIFVSNKVRLYSKFTESAIKIFKSSVKSINFNNIEQTEREINAWIANESYKLKKIHLEYKLLGDQSALIVNIVTFEGDWEKKFRKVTSEPFYSPRGVVTVPMMSREGYYNYTKNYVLKAEILEIQYEKRKASFVIVLPFSRNGLKLLLRQLKLAPELLNDALDDMYLKNVKLSVPKFKIITKQDLRPIFKSMGLRKVLSENSGLTDIIHGHQLAVSEAWQVTVIDVNEIGTTAASATAVEQIQISNILSKVIFNANRPFLFYIKSAREQIFAGTYAGL